MNIFRLQNNVPNIYPNKSRDFQVFCRLVDLYFSGVKLDASAPTNTLDADTCPERLLPLLQSKVGYTTFDTVATAEQLRKILKLFPYLLRTKGSIIGVAEAVRLFLRLNETKSAYTIEVINKQYTPVTTVSNSLWWAAYYQQYYGRKTTSTGREIYYRLTSVAPTFEMNKYYYFDIDFNNYSLLSAQPKDWQTNYFDYYKHNSIGDYVKVAGTVPPTPNTGNPAYRQSKTYTIRIVLYNQSINDTRLLNDLLSYVLPTGYTVDVLIGKDLTGNATEIDFTEQIALEHLSYNVNSAVAPSDLNTLFCDVDTLPADDLINYAVDTLNARNVGAVDTTGVIAQTEAKLKEQYTETIYPKE